MIWGIQQSSSFVDREISTEEAIEIGLKAGVDVIGGESLRLINQIEELINEGKIEEGIIDDSVLRILKAKFRMGIFENPYVDPDYAAEIVGKS